MEPLDNGGGGGEQQPQPSPTAGGGGGPGAPPLPPINVRTCLAWRRVSFRLCLD